MAEPAPGDDLSVAVAFVNTRYDRASGPVDELDTPGAARRWLLTRAGATPELTLAHGELGRVHSLRAAIRELLCALIAERAPDDEALEVLAAATAAAPGSPRLTSDDARLVRDWVVASGSPLEAALAGIASDAIALSGDARRNHLTACGAPDCARLLLRDHNRRRWCSTRCGDRVRAARYRARHRAES